MIIIQGINIKLHNKQFDHRFNLRRQHHNKQRLTFNGTLATHTDLQVYEHQFSRSKETQVIETIRIHSHNINNMS